MSLFKWLRRSGGDENGSPPAESHHHGSPREPIETRRLILRPFRDGDSAALYQLNSDQKVMRYFPGPMTRAESNAMLETLVERVQGGDITFRAVTLKAGHFIGLAGLNRPRFKAPFMPCVEVGWRFVHQAWGKGFATEAASASISYGFDELSLREIVAFTVPANTRSIRVMERLGMTRDEEGDFDHPRVPPESPLRRHLLYRLKREDWEPPA